MRVWLALAFVGLLSRASLAQDKIVQTFSGSQPDTTTAAFTVKDNWELRWTSEPCFMSITVLSSDGSVVTGTSVMQEGSLFLPKAGTYSLKISRSIEKSYPWNVSVVEVGSPLPPAPGASAPLTANYVPPAFGSATATNIASLPATPSTAGTNTDLPNPAPAGLTADQAHAIVVIKGDFGEGTGFLVKTPEGPAVVTNLHVLSANPHLKILTTTGEEVKTLSLKGASDRDLAMVMIQDNHYAYLDLAADIQDTVEAGDEVITPGNSEGGEVVLDTKGTVLGVGPQQIEISNPIYHGNSGGPVFHTKSGKVLAVVTMARKVNTSNDLDKASFDNKNSAILASMRYFGLRIDTVPKWEPYDWNRFLAETTFLKNFREQSRGLDSFMNGARYERLHLATTDEAGPPDAQYYLRNKKIVSAHDSYHDSSADADESQKLDAGRVLVIDLDGIADQDMSAVQNLANFYTFEQQRAQEEIKYRKELRTEIDKFGDHISDLGH